MRSLYFTFLCVSVLFTAACSGDDSNSTPDAGTVADTGSDGINNVMRTDDDPAYCGECHEVHYEDWQGSMHAYATVDPVFRAMLAKGIEDTDGKLDQFCIQCHAPVATKRGMTPVVDVEGVQTMPLNMENPIIGRGVVCVTCHQMESVEATKNAEFTFAEPGTLFGPLGAPAAQDAHEIIQSDLLTSSTMCGSCHNVVNPKGALLENTFSEWYASEFNDGQGEDKTCQDCHMPAYQGEVVPGVVTEIHAHTFVGVDVALVPDFPGKERQKQLVEELLRSCVELVVTRTEDEPDAAALRVSVTNINNGHALPSGSTADRQVWVHLRVTDPEGNLILESGMMDANGDLMDRVEGHSLNPMGDPDLLMWGSFLFGDNEEHVNFPWEAARSQDVLIQPGQTGWREYLVPKEGNTGKTLTATATVKYRTFPPFLIRELIAEGYLGPNDLTGNPIVDMATQQFEFVIQ